METQAPDQNTDSTDAFWGDYNLIQSGFQCGFASKIIRANNERLITSGAGAGAVKYKKGRSEKIDSILSSISQRTIQWRGAGEYQGKVIYKKGFGWRTSQELT